MKLTKLSNKVKYKGNLKPVYRLGFVPKIRQNLSSKLEYVTGQHYQYMDFVKTNGGFHKFRGGMYDVHNLTPQKLGRAVSKLEQSIANPVVNHAKWKYNIRTKGRASNIIQKTQKMLTRTSAARSAKVYGKGVKAARIALAILSRGKIKV